MLEKIKDIQRFVGKIDFGAYDECWNWMGQCKPKRYGQFKSNGRTLLAHRTSYELFRGEIPEGLVIDHLCKNTFCVNPSHLDAVTQQENVNRSDDGIINKSKTHCPAGHEYSGYNLHISTRGHRLCRTCNRERGRKTCGYKGGLPKGERTQCPKGHLYSGDNLYTRPGGGGRDCKECRANAARNWRARRA